MSRRFSDEFKRKAKNKVFIPNQVKHPLKTPYFKPSTCDFAKNAK